MLGIIAVERTAAVERTLTTVPERRGSERGAVRRKGGSAYRPGPFWRRFALWWHRRDLECACAMTTEVLKQKGRLDTEITAFLEEVPAPPFVETMAVLFLERMTADRDPEVLQTAVAELELFSVPWKAA